MNLRRVMISPLLSLILAAPLASADPLDLIRRSLASRGKDRPKVRRELRDEAPRGAKFALTALDEIIASPTPWILDDRRLELLEGVMDINPRPDLNPSFADPAVRAELIRRTKLVFDRLSREKHQPTWQLEERLLAFIVHFDLWGPEYLPYLTERIIRKSTKTLALTEVFTRVFGDAPLDARTAVRDATPGRAPFVLAASLWLVGPRLTAERTIASWLRFEIAGRGHDFPTTTRDALRELAGRLEADFTAKWAAADADVRNGLTAAFRGELEINGELSADERERVRSVAGRTACGDLL